MALRAFVPDGLTGFEASEEVDGRAAGQEARDGGGESDGGEKIRLKCDVCQVGTYLW